MLANIERYYDTVPRSAAHTEDFGPLTLFVRDGDGYQYYARPTLGHRGALTATHVRAVLARQQELGIPQSFEWVAETTPSLEAVATAEGLHVHRHPLMVLGADAETAAPAGTSDVVVRVLGPDDPVLASAIAVPHLAFNEPGTQLGHAGRPELAEQTARGIEDGSVQRAAERIRHGLSVLAAAIHDGVALCAGQHNPVGDTSEIVGVGTLPSARRRGLAQLVTAALLAEARAGGVSTVFLSAGDPDVARIYARLGFQPIGTAVIAVIAEPAE
ncbi:MAG: GNAT family N-acetyltransferase [Pseudonocardiales bacterium]|nr:MAG: GNAT family N-acetyltransferase [Pseudonocardiales bacterium]